MSKHYINPHGVEFYIDPDSVFVSYDVNSEYNVSMEFKDLEECMSELGVKDIKDATCNKLIQLSIKTS